MRSEINPRFVYTHRDEAEYRIEPTALQIMMFLQNINVG